MRVFKQEMLITHQKSLLEHENGIHYLLQHDKTEELTLLFSLYQDSPECLAPIAAAFREHIQAQGSAVVDQHLINLSPEESKDHAKVRDMLTKTELIE
jgi:hypothetical protein